MRRITQERLGEIVSKSLGFSGLLVTFYLNKKLYLNSVESTVFHKVKAFVSKYSWIKPNMLNGSMKAVMFKELWLIVDEEVVYIKDASDMPVLKTVHQPVSSINTVLMFFMLKKVEALTFALLL